MLFIFLRNWFILLNNPPGQYIQMADCITHSIYHYSTQSICKHQSLFSGYFSTIVTFSLLNQLPFNYNKLFPAKDFKNHVWHYRVHNHLNEKTTKMLDWVTHALWPSAACASIQQGFLFVWLIGWLFWGADLLIHLTSSSKITAPLLLSSQSSTKTSIIPSPSHRRGRVASLGYYPALGHRMSATNV